MTDDVEGVEENPFEQEPGEENSELENEPGDGDGIMQRAFDGDRDGPTVDSLKSDYGLSQESAIAGRGLVRMGTGSGVPPVFELGLGGGLLALREREKNDEINDDPGHGEPTLKRARDTDD
jgi:hypothetical protein